MYNLSLKQRIGIHIIIMAFIVVSVISVVTYYEFREALFRFLDDELRSESQFVMSMTASEADMVVVCSEINDFLSDNVSSIRIGYGVWTDGDDVFLSRSESFGIIRDIIKENSILQPRLSEHIIFDFEMDKKNCRGIWARYHNPSDLSGSRPLNIIIAFSSRYVIHETGEFLRMLLILGIVSVLITTGLTMFVIRWGLRPIGALTSRMDRISSRQLVQQGSEIYDLPDCPSELTPFVVAWNQMLARLADFMRRQRQFTGDASHELRTPLAVIKSSLQVARSKDRDLNYYKTTIDNCLEDVKRLEDLIEQLLELAALDSQSINMDQSVDIGGLVCEIAQRYSDEAAQKGQNINCDTNQIKLVCNEHLMSRVITNLIENAIKYGPKDKDVAISVSNVADDVILTVHDEGGRISPDEFEKIFDRFYRSDKARNKSSGGRGLGLAIAKEIVMLHKGAIEVKSHPSTGTDFIVRFKVSDKN